MELSKERVNIEMFNISFQNDYDTGSNELEIFASIVKKWNKEATKPGYKKTFNVGERALIESLYKVLFKEDGGVNVTNINGGLAHIEDEE